VFEVNALEIGNRPVARSVDELLDKLRLRNDLR
jgi:hypothetical protein